MKKAYLFCFVVMFLITSAVTAQAVYDYGPDHFRPGSGYTVLAHKDFKEAKISSLKFVRIKDSPSKFLADLKNGKIEGVSKKAEPLSSSALRSFEGIFEDLPVEVQNSVKKGAELLFLGTSYADDQDPGRAYYFSFGWSKKTGVITAAYPENAKMKGKEMITVLAD